jgi:hypothetical protein
MGFRSGEYGGRYTSLIPLPNTLAIKPHSKCWYIPFITHLVHTRDVMNLAIVENKDTIRGRVGVHDGKQSMQELEELLSIVATNLDMTVNDAARGNGW